MARELAPSRDIEELNEYERAMRVFLHAKVKIDELKAIQDEAKPLIVEYLEATVEPDDSGHRVLQFDDKIEGFAGFTRQRRVKRVTDIDKAVEILTAAGLAEDCIQYAPVVAEDAVMARLYTGDLTEEQIDEMFPQEISYALVPKKK